jgi:hypothetical protein
VVGHSPEGDLDQPAARRLRHPGLGPLERRGQQRLLDRVLGGLEVAMTTYECGKRLRRESPQQTLDVLAGTHIS